MKYFPQIASRLYVGISGVFVFLLCFATCVRPDDFEVPKATAGKCFSPQETDVISTVGELKAMALDKPYRISDPLLVEAYVVSTDRKGNFFKTISLVSADGKNGFSINLDRESLHTFFEVGRQVFVQPQALNIVKQDGGVELGVPYTAGVGRIPNAIIDSFLFRGCKSIDEEKLVQKVSSLGRFSDAQIHTLVEIDSVQFSSGSAGFHYFEPTRAAGAGTNHYIEDNKGNTLLMRMSQFSDFANATIPKGIGKVRGVLQKFNTDYQLIIRDTTDIQIYAAPQIWGFVSHPVVGTPITVRALRDSFAHGKTALGSSSYVDVTVSLSYNSTLNTGSSLNAYVQDTSGGILLRTTAPSKLIDGYRVRLDLQNATLSLFKGLLQVGNVNPKTKIELLEESTPPLPPKNITLAEIASGDYESQLVSISKVQFLDVPALLSGSNLITDGTGLLPVYTQSSATFSGGIVPKGNGNLLAIVSVFDGKPQLILRSANDVASMTGARIDLGKTATKKDLASIVAMGATLAVGQKKTFSENGYVEGVVISQKDAGNIQAQNIILQDETAGVVIRFTSDPDLPLGRKVKVTILGATLENYNGLLQLNNVEKRQIIESEAGTLPTPIKASIAEIARGKYQSMLIYLDSVQFSQQGTYVQGGANTSLTVGKCDETIEVFTRKEAMFGAQTISQKNGQLIAIPTAYNKPQLHLRSLDDVQFTRDRIVCTHQKEELMITEIADPMNSISSRFIELYNSGEATVDLSKWSLSIYAAKSTQTPAKISFPSQRIAKGEFFVVATKKDTLDARYGRSVANMSSSSASPNGDETIRLLNEKNEIVDIFGVQGDDGKTATSPWNFEDGRARRRTTILHPNASFTLNEWEIVKGGQRVPADFNPKER